MRAIFGIDRLDAGTIEIDGRAARHPLARPTPSTAGIALVPEDRGDGPASCASTPSATTS